MFNLFRNLVAAVRTAILYNRAVDHCSRSDYAQAMPLLTQIYEIHSAEIPLGQVTTETNILYSLVCAKLDRRIDAINAAIYSIQQVEKSKRYSDDEKRYLIYYCKIILEFCQNGTMYMAEISEYAKNVRFDSLRFDKVRNITKIVFPLAEPLTSETEQRLADNRPLDQ